MAGVESNTYEWPEDLPEVCPPPDAAPATVTAYRLVRSNPPAPEDFIRPIDGPRKYPLDPDAPCGPFALSIFVDPADVPVAKQWIPGFKKRHAAVRTLTPAHGVVKQEPLNNPKWPLMESHHDWWVPRTVDPYIGFTVVDL